MAHELTLVGHLSLWKRYQVKDQTYFVMRKASTGVQRSAWLSPATGELYCGICLSSRIDATVGSHCERCGSEVMREFQLIRGGVARPAVRADKRAYNAQRTAVNRTGKVLTMRAG